MEFVTVMNLCGGGGWIKGHKILSIQELVEISKQENISIIVAMANPSSVEQVLKTLEECGISDVDCYTYFALKFTIEFHINNYRINDVYRKNFNRAKTAYVEYVWNELNIMRKLNYLFSHMLYDSILIWQPGKVGSSSVFRSLTEMGTRCIHIHHLAANVNLNVRENSIWDKPQLYQKLSKGGDISSSFLHDSEKMKIISLVRDPIERSVSQYFQFFQIDGYFIYDAGYDDSDLNVYQKIANHMEQGIKIGECGSMFEWFNHEIKAALDLDVYQHNFDKERGYQIIRQNNVELLLIKTEKLNDCQKVIEEFVEAKNFKLVNDNIGNQKPYKFVYDEIKKSIQIPEHIINFYYKGNKAMDHFYTEEEKQNFIRKWTKNKIEV